MKNIVDRIIIKPVRESAKTSQRSDLAYILLIDILLPNGIFFLYHHI